MVAVGCGSGGPTELAADDAPVSTTAVATTAEPAPTADDGGAGDTSGSTGGTARDGAGTDDADPCAVLAGIDLAALVGEPVAEPKGSDDLVGASCRVEPMSGSSAGLRVVVSDQEPADNFEKQRDVLGVDSEVSGIGDEAFHTGPYLIVRAGDRLVILQVIRDSGTGFAVPDADLEAAAQTILANLGG